jgi:hypothetical protein
LEFIKKLQSIDSRIIYAVVLVCLIVPMLFPIGIPLSIAQNTSSIYEIVEALGPNDRVVLSLDYEPASSPDVHPQSVAVTQHLLQRGVKIIYVAFWEAGPLFAEGLINNYTDQYNLEYGVDIVNLGFIAGRETAIRAFGDDVLNSAPVDFRNNPTASMPIMAGIRDAKDIDLFITFSGGSPGVLEWIRQVKDVHNIKLAAGAVTVSVPGFIPFVQSGQLIGLLAGLRGAAEYEVLSGNPGSAASKMDGQSLGHLAIIVFILVGNIAYIAERRSKKSE